MLEHQNFIELKHISKTFGKVTANKDVSIDVKAGEILSLLGENGSGKTSLMNILAGIYFPDEGEIFINGEKVIISSPHDAYKYRIGMVHQHFKLVDSLNAVENVVVGLSKQDYKDFRETAKASQLEKFERIRKEEGREPNEKELANYKRLMKSTRGFNLKESAIRINRICKKFGFVVDTKKKVSDMSVSEKQTLEIIKALYRGVDTLILDEPTAVLTPQETEKLFAVLRNMRDEGKSIIIITHKLNEVLEISDRVTVLRKGEYIGTVDTKNASISKLTEMMVGKKTELNINRSKPVNTKLALDVKNLCYTNEYGKPVLNDVSFQAFRGEILGIAGIAGNGQKELLEAIAGLYPHATGDVLFYRPKKNKPVTLYHKKLKEIKELANKHFFHDLEGKEVTFEGLNNKQIKELINSNSVLFNEDELHNLREKDPLQIRELGIHLAFVPEDRLGMGLVGDMDITNNMLLRSYRSGKSPFLEIHKPEEVANEVIRDLEVATPSSKIEVKKLSGGNVQKVLVGREIAYAPSVFMVAYPVRGLDINSSYAIYNSLNKQKENGVAVVFVGEDLDVLLELCDRIMVLYDGKVSGIVDARKANKKQLGALMVGETYEK